MGRYFVLSGQQLLVLYKGYPFSSTGIHFLDFLGAAIIFS